MLSNLNPTLCLFNFETSFIRSLKLPLCLLNLEIFLLPSLKKKKCLLNFETFLMFPIVSSSPGSGSGSRSARPTLPCRAVCTRYGRRPHPDSPSVRQSWDKRAIRGINRRQSVVCIIALSSLAIACTFQISKY